MANLNAIAYESGSLKKPGTGDVFVIEGSGSLGGDLTISGNLSVSGTTTTISTTNTVVSDKLFELGNGVTGTPSGDAGIVIERGDSDNAIIAWDESVDKFIVGTTTATGASTGDLTITAGTLLANIEGDVTGDLTGNADTASAWAASRTVTFATGDVTGSFSINGSADVPNVALTIGAGAVEGTMLNSNTVDNSTLALSSNQLIVKDSGVTLAKLADLANLRVIGNLSGIAATPSAVTVIDDLANADDETLATSDSIKTYVDTATSNIATSSLTLTNNTGSAIAAGSIVGLDTTAGQIVLGSTTVHPIGVATSAISDAASGSVLTAWGQRVDVALDSSVATSIGGVVYLVAGGKVSTTPPTSGYVYRLGFATESITEGVAGATVAEIIWLPQFIADLG